jgi:hypothetical protein
MERCAQICDACAESCEELAKRVRVRIAFRIRRCASAPSAQSKDAAPSTIRPNPDVTPLQMIAALVAAIQLKKFG